MVGRLEIAPELEAAERPPMSRREVISIRETLDELGSADARCAGERWSPGKAGGARCLRAHASGRRASGRHDGVALTAALDRALRGHPMWKNPFFVERYSEPLGVDELVFEVGPVPIGVRFLRLCEQFARQRPRAAGIATLAAPHLSDSSPKEQQSARGSRNGIDKIDAHRRRPNPAHQLPSAAWRSAGDHLDSLKQNRSNGSVLAASLGRLLLWVGFPESGHARGGPISNRDVCPPDCSAPIVGKNADRGSSSGRSDHGPPTNFLLSQRPNCGNPGPNSRNAITPTTASSPARSPNQLAARMAMAAAIAPAMHSGQSEDHRKTPRVGGPDRSKSMHRTKGTAHPETASTDRCARKSANRTAKR